MEPRHEKLITFSESEMLDYWKTRLHINPARRDCSIENDDGTDLDNFLIQQIRLWYANILTTAHPSQLPQKDLANTITMLVSNSLVARIKIPEEAIQPVLLKLSSWENPVSQFYSPDSFMATLQYDEFTRGRQKSPVAIILPNEIIMYSAKTQLDFLGQAIFTIRPTQGTYILAESLLSTIPESLDNI